MYQTNQLSIVLRFYVIPHRKSATSNICALDLTGPAAMSGSRFKRCGHRLPVKQAKIFWRTVCVQFATMFDCCTNIVIAGGHTASNTPDLF